MKSPKKSKKPYVKANSRGNNFNRTAKPKRGTQKRDAKIAVPKLQMEKAKTFKKQRKHEVEVSKESLGQSLVARKHPSECQPKQSNKLMRVSSNNGLMKNPENKKSSRYLTQSNQVPLSVESSYNYKTREK